MTARAAVALATPLLLAAGVAPALQSASAQAPARPSAAPTASVSAGHARSETAAPYDFMDLGTHKVAADGTAHDFTVHYVNASSAPRSVALQILLESSRSGSFLVPADSRLDRFDPGSGQWERVSLGSQTGTLYTTIPAAGGMLRGGASIDVQYRLTVARASEAPVVQPRIVLYRSAAGSS